MLQKKAHLSVLTVELKVCFTKKVPNRSPAARFQWDFNCWILVNWKFDEDIASLNASVALLLASVS